MARTCKVSDLVLLVLVFHQSSEKIQNPCGIYTDLGVNAVLKLEPQEPSDCKKSPDYGGKPHLGIIVGAFVVFVIVMAVCGLVFGY